MTRRGLDLPVKQKGDDRMTVSMLSIWQPNMGYQMLHATLHNVFAGISIKGIYRLLKGLRLGRVKRYRTKRTGSTVPCPAPMPSDVWTIDIIHGSYMNGTKLRILGAIREFTRECLALEVSSRIHVNRVQSFVSRLLPNTAAIRFPRCGNEGEFIARSTAMLLYEANCTARFIQPAKP